jgi:uncharacterized protein
MFSYENEIAILGNAALGDRLEKVAFNALPGTFSPDMWAHQYDQQPNQVLVSLSKRKWVNNGPDSNLFGLEPNFGCCTANMHQGWPKFASSLWMAAPDNGIAAVAYSPSEVHTRAGGADIHLIEETEYPFRDRIQIALHTSQSAKFPLVLRIPSWTTAARVEVNGVAVDGTRPGEFFTLLRTWKEGDKIELTFPQDIRVIEAYHNSAVVQRGPLVYSLAIGESWHKIEQNGPASEWEIFPTTPWNYALDLDWARRKDAFRVEEKPVTKQPFSLEGSPVKLYVQARRVPEWQLEDDSAGVLPISPLVSKAPQETIELIPYAAAKLRITNFPWIEKAPSSANTTVEQPHN